MHGHANLRFDYTGAKKAEGGASGQAANLRHIIGRRIDQSMFEKAKGVIMRSAAEDSRGEGLLAGGAGNGNR